MTDWQPTHTNPNRVVSILRHLHGYAWEMNGSEGQIRHFWRKPKNSKRRTLRTHRTGKGR